MSEENPFTSDRYGAPLLPGGQPRLAGTGPHGAYPDGSPAPGDPVAEQPEGAADQDGEQHEGA